MGAFRKTIDRNAHDSCADEPGCRRFDVLVPTEPGDRVFLADLSMSGNYVN